MSESFKRIGKKGWTYNKKQLCLPSGRTFTVISFPGNSGKEKFKNLLYLHRGGIHPFPSLYKSVIAPVFQLAHT